MKYVACCVGFVALLAGSLQAQDCRRIQFRLWQDGESRFFDGQETATLEVGEKADLYIHVRSRAEGQPYSTVAEFDAPSGRALGYQTQKNEDVAKGLLRISGREVGRASVGFRLKGLRSPGRLEDVPQSCRSGAVTIAVAKTVSDEPPPPPAAPPPPPRPLADPIAVCELEIEAQLERDFGPGDGVVLYEHASYRGRSDAFLKDDPDLGDNLIRHDRASSVHVPASCEVVLYAERWYRGYSTFLEQDVQSLAGSDVGNDAASSVEVTCDTGEISFHGGTDVVEISSSERRVRGEVTYRSLGDRHRFSYTCTVDVVSGRVNEARYRR